jgi:tetratricopeptide (TPR) repeat protein
MSLVKSGDYENLIATLTFAALLVVVVSISDLADSVDSKQIVHVANRVQPVNPYLKPAAHAKEAKKKELDLRFQQAVMMLHAKQYDHAITALHRVLALAPKMPEAHANMGYALLGLEQYGAAADFFITAIELRSFYENAYYGLALSYAGLEEYEAALGAMRSYLHLAADANYRDKASAAIFEWEERLGRHKSDDSLTDH